MTYLEMLVLALIIFGLSLAALTALHMITIRDVRDLEARIDQLEADVYEEEEDDGS